MIEPVLLLVLKKLEVLRKSFSLYMNAIHHPTVISQPEVVVKHAIHDSLMGKEISVSGPVMKGFYILCKFLPHDLIMRFIK